MSNILLSICVPTFNRAHFLEKLLDSLISEKEFNESVELVISDNCSDDNTAELVSSYQKIKSNIKYVRNATNIGSEKNIFNVLSLGEGKFLKLVNDYCIFKPGSLKDIIDTVLKYEPEHSIIFFSNNRFNFKEDTYECQDFDDFIRKASFSITWIQYFGIWKKDFELIRKDTFKEYNFPHMDLLLRNLSLGYKPVIFNRAILTNPHQNNHGGYNILKLLFKII